MPEGEQPSAQPQIKTDDKEEDEIVDGGAVNEADVLEEDDDFEDFEHEVTDQQAGEALQDVEWEDDWDDEVEEKNEFARRLRAELEKSKDTN